MIGDSDDIDIAVIDYGMGNLRSVSKAIEHVAPAASVVVTSDPAQVAARGAWCFRGRARCPTACARWRRAGCAQAAHRCRPRQALPRHLHRACRCCSNTAKKATRRASACCRARCGVFPHEAMKTRSGGDKLKVPHMGWNKVEGGRMLWAGIEDRARFYFVHSYYRRADRCPTWLPASRITLSVLPVRWRAATCSRCSSTPKKARTPGCGCWQFRVTWNPGCGWCIIGLRQRLP
jgi:imidazole glycerol-phosphate synthase subunit HisH